MESQIWVVSTLLISIVLIVLTIVKLKFHPFLALLRDWRHAGLPCGGDWAGDDSRQNDGGLRRG